MKQSSVPSHRRRHHVYKKPRLRFRVADVVFWIVGLVTASCLSVPTIDADPTPTASPANVGSFKLAGAPNFNFTSAQKFCGYQPAGYFVTDLSSVVVTPAFVFKGERAGDSVRLNATPVQSAPSGSGFRFAIFLQGDPPGIKEAMAEELRDAANSTEDLEIKKYKSVRAGQLVSPFLADFTVSQATSAGQTADFETLSLPGITLVAEKPLFSRVFSTKEEAESVRTRYIQGEPFLFHVIARMYATKNESESAASQQQSELKQTTAYGQLKGAAPLLKIENTGSAVTLGDKIPLTRDQRQDFEGKLTAEVKQKFTIQNPEDLQFLQAQLDKLLRNAFEAKDITDQFGKELSALRAYGFSAEELKPDEIDKVVTDVKNFFQSESQTSFSTSANASFCGISGGGSFSKTDLEKRMTDKGWKFESQGHHRIPKSLHIDVLDTTKLETSGTIYISVTKQGQSSLQLDQTISSTALYDPTAVSWDVGEITASFLPYELMSPKWRSSWFPCDGRDVDDSTGYAQMRRKAIAQGQGWEGEVNPETKKIRIPDLRGQFLRGLNQFADKSGTVGGIRSDGRQGPRDPQNPNKPDGEKKPERKAGDWQEDALAKHVHLTPFSPKVPPLFHEGADARDKYYVYNPTPDNKSVTDTGWDRLSEKGNKKDRGGKPLESETRPNNVTVYYYIKVN